jgi:plastocyanin
MTRRLLAVLVVAGVIGCAPDPNDDPNATYPANGQRFKIQAIDNTFRLPETTVVAGTEVVWQNRGRNDHNIVPTDGDDWGVADPAAFAPKQFYAHVFDRPGRYPYYCSIHGTSVKGMVGVVVVTVPVRG